MLTRIKSASPKVLVASGVVALVALGGGSAAAKSFVTGADIKNDSVTGADIRDGSLHLADLDERAAARLDGKDGRDGKDGATGATGATGPKGTKGNTGATGAAGAAGAAGKDGAPGVQGDTGAMGATGPQGGKGDQGAPGANGVDGTNGTNGKDGKDGLNPAVPVEQSGEAGWAFTGTPTARLAGGELRLGGGFDPNTVAGGIGMIQAQAAKPSLASLSALTYTARVDRRPDGTVNAPVIHVTLTGARRDGSASTFTNLVFEPANNGGIGVHETRTFETTSGLWWSTNALVGHPRQATAALADFVRDNPDAKVTAVSIDNGGSSGDTIPADAFAAAADGLVLGLGDSFTRYDFGG